MLTVGLLGDVMLGRGVGEVLERDPAAIVWDQELRDLAAGLDLVVCNLECCLSQRGWPTDRIPGKPFFFRGPPHAVRQLQALHVGAVSLANNHALDFETDALLDTLDVLDEAAIARAGAGRDPDEARRGAIVEAGGKKVGLVAVSDHPGEYAAAPGRPGIAHVDWREGAPGWVQAQLERLRAECDAVIAFPHWGPNMNPASARWQLDRARQMQEAGADLVAGHSAHVFHGVAWTEDKPIVTDLGDALDDYRIDRRLRNDLGVLALWRPHDREQPLELVGLKLEYAHTGLAAGEDADWIARRLERACAALRTKPARVAEARFAIEPV